ncbi:MAG: SufD family Fe-S cluster assembly protein [Alphaproteobacteria bacterium]|nr:SufD family Fe-S cluster assembly protein [Alphaproteobacteria bacterium]MCB9695547.1 SufD family Fe-S cluster assembly protein [Alphaproteobacteria bacterium]
MTGEELLGLARDRTGGATLADLPAARDEAHKYTPFARLLGEVPAVAATLRTTGEGLESTELPVRDAWSALAHGATVRTPASGRVDVVHELVGDGVAGGGLVVDADGDLLLVERFTGNAGLALPCTTIRVPAGVTVEHVRVVDADGRHAGRVTVEVEGGGRYRLVSVLAGGAVDRVEIDVRLSDAGAEADLHGLVVLGGSQHADHHVTVRHDAPSCTSRQEFRALVSDRARSVFTGRVVVRRGADGTDAGQLHRALLLSDTAVANARPQLEIHTDDVKASHGTAVGTLDDEALFYLRQRGLDADQARALLVGAFAAEVVDAAPEAAREELRADLQRWTNR